MSFIFTFIGFGSLTLTIIVYVLVLPFSAVTVTFILFSPSVTSCVPVPLTLAFESSLEAFTLTLSVLDVASTLYSVVFLLNSGFNFNPSIDKLFKLLFFDYVASSCARVIIFTLLVPLESDIVFSVP